MAPYAHAPLASELGEGVGMATEGKHGWLREAMAQARGESPRITEAWQPLTIAGQVERLEGVGGPGHITGCTYRRNYSL